MPKNAIIKVSRCPMITLLLIFGLDLLVEFYIEWSSNETFKDVTEYS